MEVPTSTLTLSEDRVVGYATAGDLGPLKPTLLLLHAFGTSASLFAPQFGDAELKKACNLVAVDLIGHGKTVTGLDGKGWSFWDNAQMCLDVLEELDVTKAFVLGVSQGGFVALRMTLLESKRVSGLILIGSSILNESPKAVEQGACDVRKEFPDALKILEADDAPGADFELQDDLVAKLISSALGPEPEKAQAEFWGAQMKDAYKGEAGGMRFKGAMAAIMERDSLEDRAKEILQPVLIAQGTDDPMGSTKLARFMKTTFTGASVRELEIVQGGKHFLNISHPIQVKEMALKFMKNNFAGRRTLRASAADIKLEIERMIESEEWTKALETAPDVDRTPGEFGSADTTPDEHEGT